ncbi:hypothetical protein [Hymenobacter negativus]|uniref:Uncharacterized protein n=1 Tax=Hymenobacter negativus TaxID=2795026 RepID=A0ABS3QFG4_9BACT|nr:hypothetical protein [Hymenobacter negativus]MBO2009430.1 hypothetical protein [Hymenobacter negativus]
MSTKKLFVLLVALLLKAASGRAQTAKPPTPDDYQQVSVPVPRAVSLLSDVAGVLLTRDPDGKGKVQALLDRRKERSEKRDQSLKLSIPKNGLTRTLGLVE